MPHNITFKDDVIRHGAFLREEEINCTVQKEPQMN